MSARIRGNVVILKGDPLQDTSRVREWVDATDGDPAVSDSDKTNIYPGMLLSYDSASAKAAAAAIGKTPGDVPHATDTGMWTGSVADFRDYVGDGLSVPYEDGDTMQVLYPYPGCILRGLYKRTGNVTDLAVGDPLVSAGDGSLKKAPAVAATVAGIKAGLYVVGYATEIVDISAVPATADLKIGTDYYTYIAWRVK